MNLFNSIVLLSTITLLGTGCISRTVSVDHQNRGEQAKQSKKFGSQPSGAVTEKKIIWFWQEDFRKPK